MTLWLYLALLPLAVWVLGSVFGLLDQGDSAPPLARTGWRLLPVLAVALLFRAEAAMPLLAAFGTALSLHVAWAAGLRAAIRRGWFADSEEP